MGRVGPLLDPGEGRPAARGGVTVAVKEPVLPRAAWNEFLQHEPGTTTAAGTMGVLEFRLVSHDRGAAKSPVAMPPRRSELGDQWEARVGGEFASLAQ